MANISPLGSGNKIGKRGRGQSSGDSTTVTLLQLTPRITICRFQQTYMLGWDPFIELLIAIAWF